MTGLLAAVFAAGTIAIVGRLSNLEALRLLSNMLPSARFLSSAVMAASATILALMLTLLSLSYNTQSTLTSVHYRRVRLVAKLSSAGLIAATLLLLLITLPLGESEQLSTAWYQSMFYVILLSATGLGGFLIALVLVLYTTIRDMIHVIQPDKASELDVSGEHERREGPPSATLYPEE